VLLAAAVPRAAIRRAIATRRDRQRRRTALPALIDAIAAALAAGLSLEQAFAEVAPTLPAGLARPTAAVATAIPPAAPEEIKAPGTPIRSAR